MIQKILSSACQPRVHLSPFDPSPILPPVPPRRLNPLPSWFRPDSRPVPFTTVEAEADRTGLSGPIISACTYYARQDLPDDDPVLYLMFIMGWAVEAVNNRRLTIKARLTTLKQRCPAAGPLNHADQGRSCSRGD